MPYRHKGLRIPNELDSRAKLTPDERLEIRQLYEDGEHSQRELARMFGVSRRLVQYCIDPEKLARHKQQYAARQADGRYYDKDKHREYIKKHRRYKQKLKIEGKLKEVQ